MSSSTALASAKLTSGITGDQPESNSSAPISILPEISTYLKISLVSARETSRRSISLRK
jgi:hypothetical protein